MDATWQELQSGLTRVYSINLSSTTQNMLSKNEYIRLYTLIYDSCSKKHHSTNKKQEDPSKYLYEHLQIYITEYITSLSAETQIQTLPEGLQKFNQLWANYNLSSIIISNLFNYINRIWVKSISEKAIGILEIHRLTQVAWIIHILDQRIGQLDKIINELINSERDGEVINTRLVSNFIGSLLSLGCETDTFGEHKGSLCIYRKYFETNFLANTAEYYSRRALELIQQTDITGYMLVIADWIIAENHRVTTYIHDISRTQTNTILEDCLIRNFAQQMVAELPHYLNSGMSVEIGVLYSLMKRINNLQLMADMFGEFVLKNGQSAISALADDDHDKFMTAVIDVYSKGHQILKEHFKFDMLFVSAFDKANKTYINTNSLTTTIPGANTINRRAGAIAQILGRYTDSILRGSSKSIGSCSGGDDDVEVYLENITNIFKYLEDKDIYQKFYAKYLAKRLISGKIISEETENSMISKLKSLCGMEYTSRFQTMTKDLTASREIVAKYKSSSASKSASGFDILVLTSGSWPIQATQSSELILPLELHKLTDAFTVFYHANTQGRKLTWMHNLSYGDLITNYIKGSDGKLMKYVFQASGIQMVILLAFNQSETLTLTDLAQATGMKPEVLRAQMELLVKMKILKLKPDSTDKTSDNPTYHLNTKYSYKKTKVNINQPVKAELAAESSELVMSAEEDRTYAIQATIVRIMKSRNVLSHALLIGETIQQCSKYFTPKVPSIKKNIDSLIEKEYLQRSEGKRDEYTYVA
jgi:cullin 1